MSYGWFERNQNNITTFAVFALAIVGAVLIVLALQGKLGLTSRRAGDYRDINRPVVTPEHVVGDGVYIGPNTDGYKYIGSDPLMQQISPRAHRYDVDEAESLEYWDLFHKREGDYTYGIRPTDSNLNWVPEDKDMYMVLT